MALSHHQYGIIDINIIVVVWLRACGIGDIPRDRYTSQRSFVKIWFTVTVNEPNIM